MKIKLDENPPHELAQILEDLGHDLHTIHEENLIGCADSLVWDAAQKETRFLITQDLDFSDIRRFSPGTHAGILLLRLGEPSRLKLLLRVRELFNNETVEQWHGCFVIATERKVRILKNDSGS